MIEKAKWNKWNILKAAFWTIFRFTAINLSNPWVKSVVYPSWNEFTRVYWKTSLCSLTCSCYLNIKFTRQSLQVNSWVWQPWKGYVIYPYLIPLIPDIFLLNKNVFLTQDFLPFFRLWTPPSKCTLSGTFIYLDSIFLSYAESGVYTSYILPMYRHFTFLFLTVQMVATGLRNLVYYRTSFSLSLMLFPCLCHFFFYNCVCFRQKRRVLLGGLVWARMGSTNRERGIWSRHRSWLTTKPMLFCLNIVWLFIYDCIIKILPPIRARSPWISLVLILHFM